MGLEVGEFRPQFGAQELARELDGHRRSLTADTHDQRQLHHFEGLAFLVCPILHGGCGGAHESVGHENAEDGAEQGRGDLVADRGRVGAFDCPLGRELDVVVIGEDARLLAEQLALLGRFRVGRDLDRTSRVRSRRREAPERDSGYVLRVAFAAGRRFRAARALWLAPALRAPDAGLDSWPTSCSR